MVRRHVSNAANCREKNAVVQRTVVLPTAMVMPGDEPFDVAAYFDNRCDAWSVDSLEERIQHLKTHRQQFLEYYSRTPDGVSNILSTFSYLWGPLAPERFRCFVMHRSKVYSQTHVYDHVSMCIGESVGDLFACIRSVCVSIREHLEELRPAAMRMMGVVNMRSDSITLEDDAMTLSTRFELHRHRLKSMAQTSKRLRKGLRVRIMAMAFSQKVRQARGACIPITLYTCTQCHRNSPRASVIKQHIEKSVKCGGAQVRTSHASYIRDDGDVMMVTRGHPVFDERVYFKSRIPMWTAEAYDERANYLIEKREYLFDQLRRCNTDHGYILKIYHLLWGDVAPARFRSLVVTHQCREFGGMGPRRYKVFVLGEDGCIDRYESVSKCVGEIMARFFAHLRKLCTETIPQRVPELVDYGREIVNVLDMQCKGVTLLDSIRVTPLFVRHRKKIRREVPQMIDIGRALRTTISSTISDMKYY